MFRCRQYKYKLMSLFRNLQRVVSSQILTKPNALLLPARFRPVYLQSSEQPNIEHLHSLKPLFLTIQALIPHLDHGSYSDIVDRELSNLEAHKNTYRDIVARFVSQAGLLTGNGIANVYYAATQEEGWLSGEWLEENLHHQIPTKYKNMSRSNLQDTLAGLQKFHPNSPYLSRVEQELKLRSDEKPIHVQHQANESVKYEYCADVVPRSNHPLVDALNRQLPVWRYHIQSTIAKALSGNKQALHHP